MSSPPTVRPPRPLCCLLWLCSSLSCFWSTPNTQLDVTKWLSHPPLEYTHHALPPLCQLWLPHLSLENAHHARPSTSCGYVASHQSLEYARHAQPGVAKWLSHPSLEYAHHAHLAASASCGYLVYPWSTPTTPSQVWLCGYLTHPWSTPTTPTPLPLWLRGYLVYPWSTHTTPSQVWLSHPSLEYAHLSASASCGYVAISPIPGVRPPRPPLCQLWLRGYLTHPRGTPTTPTSLPAVATWLSHPSLEYAHHAHPSATVATWLSRLSLEYAHHAQPGVAISPVPGVRPPLSLCQLWLRGYLTYPRSTPTTPTSLPAVATWLSHPSPEYAHHAHLSASCGYVAISPIPGVHPPRPPLCQLWLGDYLTYPWSTHTTPSQVWLCGYFTHP